MDRAQADKTLRIISRAWGKRQKGYVFFPYIDRNEQERSGSRKAGYHEGPNTKNPAFQWPEERERIIDHLLAHQNDDLYWCPSLFEYPWRREDAAADEHALWADLDSIDPHQIRDYPPTIAWETSPGRYQALWVAGSGDFQGASWPGNENQRLTYHLGADKSGWDTTQLLRVPGWKNHKPSYRKGGKAPQGKLLWSNGQTYFPGDFKDLPSLNQGENSAHLTEALESEINKTDRAEVMARIKLQLSPRVRELLSAREVSGDRSSVLWDIERSLADIGCSVAEIVALVQPSVWNKYVDRSDELRRLIQEASKAISLKPETLPELEDETVRGKPERLGSLLKNVKPPKFVVENLFTEGACGFIAAEPKCYKSWNALDLALSIATGASYLGYFKIIRPGPVLYIQEEDPKPTIKARTGKIWLGKQVDKVVLTPDGLGVEWLPPKEESKFDPDINGAIQQGVVISEGAWQEWLDEVLTEGMDNTPYRAVIIDTLMMVAGDVEENKSQAMTNKIFKPLKVLSRKHNVLILLVHHLNKSEKPRAGSRLLGSVANHAWGEDSIYLHRTGNEGTIKLESESKSVPGQAYRIRNLDNKVWEPIVTFWSEKDSEGNFNPATPRQKQTRPARKVNNQPHPVVKIVQASDHPMTSAEILEKLDKPLSRAQVWRQLSRAEENGLVVREPGTNNTFKWRSVV